jgi:hypothetical protein
MVSQGTGGLSRGHLSERILQHGDMLRDVGQHTCAHNGDHLITPFQCVLHVFCNLMGHNPTANDGLLLACIQQVDLDALWG